MSRLSARRRRVVVLCAAIAAMSGGPLLLKNHFVASIVWIALMVVILVYAIAEIAKLKREES